MQEELVKLIFGANKSLRYLAKRRAFFDALHRTSMALSFVGGSAALVALIGDQTTAAKLVAVFLTLNAMFDLAIGYSARARAYDELYRRWSNLLAEITREGSPDDDKIRDWLAERVHIQSDEPTPISVLNIVCHNEEAVAQGYEDDHVYRVWWWQRWAKQLLSLPPNRFRSLAELTEQKKERKRRKDEKRMQVGQGL